MPPARNAHAQALIGTDLWVFGGRTSVEMGEGALDDIWRFDTVAEVWHGPVASGGAPAPRSYHAGCAAGGRFYIFGGCGEAGRLNDFHCFDPEKAAWRELPTPPGVDGRGGPTLEAFWGGRTLLLFAGFAGRETRDVLTFDIESEKWTPAAHGTFLYLMASGDSIYFPALKPGEVPIARAATRAPPRADAVRV